MTSTSAHRAGAASTQRVKIWSDRTNARVCLDTNSATTSIVSTSTSVWRVAPAPLNKTPSVSTNQEASRVPAFPVSSRSTACASVSVRPLPSFCDLPSISTRNATTPSCGRRCKLFWNLLGSSRLSPTNSLQSSTSESGMSDHSAILISQQIVIN